MKHLKQQRGSYLITTLTDNSNQAAEYNGKQFFHEKPPSIK